MNLTERRNNLSSLHEQGLLRPVAWSIDEQGRRASSIDEQGRHVVCLLSAISPEVEAAKSVYACPVDVMPLWLAHLIMCAYEDASDHGRTLLVQFCLDTMSGWSQLSPIAWTQCELTVLLATMDLVLPIAGASASVVTQVRDLITRAMNGDEPSEAEWMVAKTEAADVAAWASWVASAAWVERVERGTEAAAAWAAVWEDVTAARAAWAAETAARAATATWLARVAWAARAAAEAVVEAATAEAASVTRWAARAATWDQIIRVLACAIRTKNGLTNT
jgi:hypothetical protein